MRPTGRDVGAAVDASFGESPSLRTANRDARHIGKGAATVADRHSTRSTGRSHILGLKLQRAGIQTQLGAATSGARRNVDR